LSSRRSLIVGLGRQQLLSTEVYAEVIVRPLVVRLEGAYQNLPEGRIQRLVIALVAYLRLIAETPVSHSGSPRNLWTDAKVSVGRSRKSLLLSTRSWTSSK
jgi:hypothetical protein